MNKYILDTNIISYIEMDSILGDKIKSKLEYLSDDDIVCTSIITLFEMEYGINLNTNIKIQDKIKKAMYFTQKYLSIIPLDIKEVSIFGNIKSKYLKSTGIDKNIIKKHNLDLLLASTAISENAILISNDKIFEKLSKIEPNLKYENWLK